LLPWGMRAYALDFRQDLLRACNRRLGPRHASAAIFGVKRSFVEKLLWRSRTTGDIMPGPRAGGRRALLVLRKMIPRVCDGASRGADCKIS
jgi:hypothetical protein